MVSNIEWHCLRVEGNEELVKEALRIFDGRIMDFSLNVTFITCHITDTVWYQISGDIFTKDDEHKEVFSLEELFSINPELYTRYLKYNTKLGSLL